jgi:hypothetical protein
MKPTRAAPWVLFQLSRRTHLGAFMIENAA